MITVIGCLKQNTVTISVKIYLCQHNLLEFRNYVVNFEQNDSIIIIKRRGKKFKLKWVSRASN